MEQRQLDIRLAGQGAHQFGNVMADAGTRGLEDSGVKGNSHVASLAPQVFAQGCAGFVRPFAHSLHASRSSASPSRCGLPGVPAALESSDEIGQALWLGQIKVRHELAAYFAEDWNVAAHGRQAALHGFHQRQAEAFDVGRKHQRTGVGVGMFEAGVAQVVKHEQSGVQLRVTAHPGEQGIALPANAPGDAQTGGGARAQASSKASSK